MNETKSIDSLNYQTKHQDLGHLFAEISKTQNYLIQKGFIETLLVNQVKINDSSYIANLDLGKRITTIKVTSSINPSLKKILQITQDTMIVKYSQISNFLNNKKQLLNNEGYPLATVNLTDLKKGASSLIATLVINPNKQKQINTIIVAKNNNTSFQFPKGHLNQIVKKFKNNLLSDNTINKIKEEFDKYNFVTQSKYPETLFTHDSTKIYVYIEKQHANTFDGFIGFNTNENQKLTLSGYLDLQLENILNTGEEFRLNWKSNGNNQTTFNSTLELPYLFGSPIGLKAQLNILKQESTFQNTKTALDASYYIKYNTRIYIGRETTSSSDIQNINNGEISDFNSTFYTSSFSFKLKERSNSMNPIKSHIDLKLGIGKRENTNEFSVNNINQQKFIALSASNTFHLNQKNHLNAKALFQSLVSKEYGQNELYRFGGINSIRGFQENSLLAKTYLVLSTEYRYLLNDNFYLNTVTDYSNYTSPNTFATNTYVKRILSFGLGIGLQTRTGLMKILLVKPYSKNDKTVIYNTIAHFSYNVKF